MKSIFGKLAVFSTAFLIGGLLVPLIVAAGEAALVRSDKNDRYYEAQKLISVYQNQLPEHHLFLTIMRREGRDCGYDSEKLFPSPGSRSQWEKSQVELVSSFLIEEWEAREQDKLWISAIADRISENSSAFSIAFLRRCIEGTILRPFCVSKVSSFGEGVERFPAKPNLKSIAAKHTYCTFMDGIAARRSIPLVERNEKAVTD